MTRLPLAIKIRTACSLVSLVVTFGLVLVLAGRDQLHVLFPVLTAIGITIMVIVVLWNRAGVVPVFDIGCITVLATLVYTVIPPIQYMLSGMQHTVLSAYQFYILDPTPQQMGAFTWRYTIYLASLAAGYVVLPDPPGIQPVSPVPDRGTIPVLIGLFLLMWGFLYALKQIYGIDPNVVYTQELLSQVDASIKAMPLLLQQIFGIVSGMFFLIKLGIMMILVLNWRKRFCRIILLVWLASMLIGYILAMGARTPLVLTFFAAVILYHHFVNPLSPGRISAAGTAIFAGFLIFGAMRGHASFGANVENLQGVLQHQESIFSLANEFQVLFAGAYDLLIMKENGIIKHVPLQFLFYDAVMLIPQQFLPFTKMDVQNWYLDLSMNPGFFMFNPVAQSVLGFGWVELIARGALLGLTFAWLRRWYLRNSSNFWITLLYGWLIVESYYTIRSTPFYHIAHMLLYVFAPIYLLVRLMVGLSKIERRRIGLILNFTD